MMIAGIFRPLRGLGGGIARAFHRLTPVANGFRRLRLLGACGVFLLSVLCASKFTRRGGRELLFLVSLGLVSACSSDPSSGYSFTDAHRADIRTIAVPVFDNTTFSHGLEFTLTDAIVKEIHRTTPWRVAARDDAESVLSGSITGANLRRLSRNREHGMAQELAVDLTVNFEWKRSRSGEVLVARSNFHAAEPFVPARGARERLNLGQRAAIDQLAKDLVAELRSSW